MPKWWGIGSTVLELWRIWPRQAQLLKERGPRSNYSNWAPPTESAAVSSTLMVTGSIERECVKMLVDTGSAVTILREDTWKRAQESHQLQLHPPVCSVVAATNGEDLDLLGQSEVTLGIRGLAEKHMILIANELPVNKRMRLSLSVVRKQAPIRRCALNRE